MLNGTLRQKIFLGFCSIIGLSSILIVITYFSMGSFRKASKNIPPIIKHIEILENQLELTPSIESNLETYILTHSQATRKVLEVTMQELMQSAQRLRGAQYGHGKENAKLITAIAKAQADIDLLDEVLYDNALKKQINRRVIRVYKSIAGVRKIQEAMQVYHLSLFKKTLKIQDGILNTLLFRIVFMGIIIVLAGIGLALLLSHFIARSLLKLEQAASAIAKGDLDTQVKYPINDEIGNLAKALEVMRKTLQEYSAGLERKIELRTQELQKKNRELEKFNQLVIGRELRMVELKKNNIELKTKLAEKQSE